MAESMLSSRNVAPPLSLTESDVSTMIETQIETSMKSILLAAHPVGSFYWSENSTSPKELFGGEWEQIKDRFVLAAGDAYAAGTTGGKANHTLSINQLPSRTVVSIPNNTGAAVSTSNAGWANSQINSGAYNAVALYDAELVKMVASYGQSINNMPPYLVAYCWKRTA